MELWKLLLFGIGLCVLSVVWWFKGRGGLINMYGPCWLLSSGIGLVVLCVALWLRS